VATYSVYLKAMNEETLELDNEYIAQVGERLRSIRRQKRMSLLEVEAASGKEFKASVLGAYERGERAISVPRLQRLAGIYAVPVAQLLPAGDEVAETDDRSLGMPFGARTAMTIDLERLRDLEGSQAELVNRYLRGIQVQRQDFNGKVLTVRSDDLRALACMLGVASDAAVGQLENLGLAYRV
jgi:transcriptional regulator with XRE-family HTH domain